MGFFHGQFGFEIERPPYSCRPGRFIIGTAFWCRREALWPLFEHPWSFDDFSKEHLPSDGVLNHELEFIFPFVAQHQGYLTGWIMTEEYASLEINNLHYMLVTSVQKTGRTFSHFTYYEQYTENPFKYTVKTYIKKHFKGPLFNFARWFNTILLRR